MRKQGASIEFERVDVQHFQALATETLAQEIGEACILFDCENARAFLKKEFCQRSQTGTDFEHVIVRSNLRLIDNPSRKVLVVQKILTKRFDRRNVYFLKRRPYVGEPHGKVSKDTASPGEIRLLSTKLCKQNMQEPRIIFTSY